MSGSVIIFMFAGIVLAASAIWSVVMPPFRFTITYTMASSIFILYSSVFQSMPSVPLQHTAVKKQKMSLAEKRATMHGVQTYLSDEDYELRLRQKRVVKRYYVML